MIYDFSKLRIKSEYPPMPPYANPETYLEESFFNAFHANKDKVKTNKKYLAVWWTPIYVQQNPIPVQEYLNALPQNEEYFTIVQFDDGVLHTLPRNTTVFAAASDRGSGTYKVPIPLVVSKIPQEKLIITDNKKYLCSFVGRMTHPLRQYTYEVLRKYKDCYFPPMENWQQTLPSEKLDEFITITSQSAFTLAIRGNAPASFRLYEAMQLNSVPVYVSDKHWLPWEEQLKWQDFCVIIKPDQIYHMHDILMEIYNDKERYNGMLRKAKELYDDWFTLEGTCNQILKRL